MKIKPQEEGEHLEPISLHGMTLEEALKRAPQAKVDPNEPRKPGAGRKEKQAAE